MSGMSKSGKGPAAPSRRVLIKAGGLGLAALAGPLSGITNAATPAGRLQRPAYKFFTASEAVFIEAATARLIPGNAESPGAAEADVPIYIDHALAGGWGDGAGLYRSGPWQTGVPGQGYQLKLTPAELYRAAIGSIEREFGRSGTAFATLAPEEQDAFLKKLEQGLLDLDGVPSNVFFDVLLQNTVEGFFSDPLYGGNRNMVGWKLVGFPGAYASWYDLVDKHGIDLSRRLPMSITPEGTEAAPSGSHMGR